MSDITDILTPPPADYELHPAVASLLVRQAVALENEGIGPRAPWRGVRDTGDPDGTKAYADRFESVEIGPAKFPTGDREPTDAEVVRQAYVKLGLDPELDYGS